MPSARADIADRLRPFADTTYLHQVVERRRAAICGTTRISTYALDARGDAGRDWRIHFHVPLFARDYDGFGSTQDYVERRARARACERFTTHLEIETYTWDVLPPGLKLDLGESIAREYDWVLQTIARHDRPRDSRDALDAHDDETVVLNVVGLTPGMLSAGAAAGALGRRRGARRGSTPRFPPSPAPRSPTT